MLRRLKKSFLCALVVAIFTIRQLRRMYSWISALIQWIANDARRTPRSGSKRLHRLHQADVAFLDEVGLRQPVAHVVARDGHHEAQVRKHQVAGRGQILVVAQATTQLELALCGQHGDGVHGLDVRLQARNGRKGGQTS